MSVTGVLIDLGYPQLKELVLGQTGLTYYSDRDEDLAARLSRRMTARGISDCSSYMRLLEIEQTRGTEWDALIGEITIGETYFFRQAEHFNLLRSAILPELIERKQGTRQLRIWSAGCATGAEPYSISLLLHLDFREALEAWDVSILATDINVDFLAQARAGRFTEWALREIPESVRKCCFRRIERFWELAAEYRQHVRFEYHNLVSTMPYPGSAELPFDIILCRNVMIYFSQDRIRQVARRLHDVLAPGGWLLVGHAEPNSLNFPQFEVVIASETTAYRKALPDSDRLPVPAFPTDWTAPFEQLSRPTERSSKAPVRSRQAEQKPTVSHPSIEIVVTESDLLIEQAHALADKGDWQAAEDLCMRVIEADALHAQAHFMLGVVQYQHSSVTEAEASLRRAIYLNRSFTLAHYHLGLLLQRNGAHGQARRSFLNVIDLLTGTPEGDIVPYGDGILTQELRELANMHLENGKRR